TRTDRVHRSLPARRLCVVGRGGNHLGPRRPDGRHPRLRRHCACGLPRLRDLDDHGPRLGHPACRATDPPAVQPGLLHPCRAAAPRADPAQRHRRRHRTRLGPAVGRSAQRHRPARIRGARGRLGDHRHEEAPRPDATEPDNRARHTDRADRAHHEGGHRTMSPQLSSPGDRNPRETDPREANPRETDRDAELGIGRGRWIVRDIPVVIWLVFLLIVVGAHPGLPVARWLMIHLLVLGAVSHSILVWSQYFAQALLHTPTTPADRRTQSIRLGLINTGTLIVIIGMMTTIWTLVIIGAAAVAAAVIWHGVDLWTKVRRALASRFAGTVHYYLAAAAILPVGVTFGVILARDIADPWYSRLLAAHGLLNLLGWIGLTVIGTLMTLWPTMLRTKIIPGAEAA